MVEDDWGCDGVGGVRGEEGRRGCVVFEVGKSGLVLGCLRNGKCDLERTIILYVYHRLSTVNTYFTCAFLNEINEVDFENREVHEISLLISVSCSVARTRDNHQWIEQ